MAVKMEFNRTSGQDFTLPCNGSAVNIFQGLNLDEKQKKSFSKKTDGIENRFSTLIEIIPSPLVILEFKSGNVIYANSKTLELFEVEKTVFFSNNFFEYFIFPEDLNNVLNEIQKTGKIENKEIQLLKETKNYFISSISAKLDDYDGVQILIMNIKDISEEKNDEEEKERLLEELRISKEQIEEEAGKINMINYQLEESEQKLQELNAAKDKLFSIIGHDLKNPFFIISSYSEILNEDFELLPSEERVRIINTIGETSKFAHRLLENLLSWARSQTGRMEYIPTALELKKIVNNSLELLNSQAQKKGITLSAEVSASFMVHADKNMLDTVLRNLVANAIKFTNPEGFVKINAVDIDEFVKIIVSDSGIGLTESDLSKLFRIDVNNTEIGSSKEKGTGLGLILCKEFVERHGGKVWVESEFGKGSQFIFTIPKIRTFA